MNKKNWMLLLLLLSSLFLVSCKEKETNINETADLLINTTETLREDTEYTEPEQAGKFYISYNGEIQQFDAEAGSITGLIKNIKSLLWLAPRGGLEMELISENISEQENVYIYKSINFEDEGDSDLVWLRISDNANDEDQGTGTSIPENQDILVYIQQEDLYIGIQNSNLKWQIWKLAEYGDWLEKEIKIFIRVATGI